MMMEEPKRICTSNNYDSVVVDRISGLPDCILGVILSFLPTKQAVSTSLLSKRWKFSWLDVLNLHFDATHHRRVVAPPDDAENMAFIRFVHRVLLLIGAKPLNKFSLRWADGISLSHVICWLDAAILRKVREVDLYYLLDNGDYLSELPIRCFSCDSLRSLQVQNVSFVYDATDVCLPRLENLELEGVYFTSEEAFEKLINGCPMLWCFNLHVDKDLDNDDDTEEDFMYIVSSPSLTLMRMHIGDRCTLKLKAPALESCILTGRISEIIFVDKSLSSLVKAYFSIEMDGHLSHNGAVCALEHAKFLNLSTTAVTRALAPATACLSTKFTRLYIDAPHDVPPSHSRWTAPVVVPRCLSKSLKKVRLSGYSGLEDEREMIRFMLEHGNALEVVQISCKNQGEDGEKLLKEICEFPRKCAACEVSTWVPPY